MQYVQFAKRIKVKDVKCGFYHVLFIDFECKIYGFGRNLDGQCGDGGSTENIQYPKQIATLGRYNVVKIRCGAYHSYAMSETGEHFMFGDNYYFQCLVFDDGKTRIQSPICVNEEFEKQTDGAKIKDIFLGNGNTMILT